MNTGYHQGTREHVRNNTSLHNDNNNDNSSSSNTVVPIPQSSCKLPKALPSPFSPIKYTVNGTAIIDNDERS